MANRSRKTTLREAKEGSKLPGRIFTFLLGFCCAFASQRSLSITTLSPAIAQEQQRQDGNCACNGEISTISTAPPSQSHMEGFEEDEEDSMHLLEDLLFKYKSDKSHDDHQYSDAYQMIFRHIRKKIHNMTEIGVNAGQSLQAWYHYFPNARIRGFDVTDKSSVPKILEQMGDRISFQKLDVLKVPQEKLATEVDLYENSMDLIVEDANHIPDQQEDLLNHLWKLVKPGGFYIIEDITMATDVTWGRRFWTHPEHMRESTRRLITEEFDSMLVDASTGHRNWTEWNSRTNFVRTRHNSFLMILRRRAKPLPAFKMFFKTEAMQVDKVVYDDP